MAQMTIKMRVRAEKRWFFAPMLWALALPVHWGWLSDKAAARLLVRFGAMKLIVERV